MIIENNRRWQISNSQEFAIKVDNIQNLRLTEKILENMKKLRCKND